MSVRFSDQLRDANIEHWQACVEHRFVKELCAGTIADAAMARYLVQDHRFIDHFLMLLGSALASCDNFASKIRIGKFIGAIAGDENTYFIRSFNALGVSEQMRHDIPDHAPTHAFKALMQEAADSRDYAAIIAVICVAEWLYLDWAQKAPAKRPENFIHHEWIELHDNPFFCDFVAFLRSELDRIGEKKPDIADDFFRKAITIEHAFFDMVYH